MKMTISLSIVSTSRKRRAVTLLEVLLSIGVVFIGLMGAASLFPVASFQTKEGTKHERAAIVGKRAVREFRSRDMSDLSTWVARDNTGNYGSLTTAASLPPFGPLVYSPFYRVLCLDPRGLSPRGTGGITLGDTLAISVPLAPALNLGNTFPALTDELMEEVARLANTNTSTFFGSFPTATPAVSARVTLQSAPGSTLPMLAEQSDALFVVEDELDFEIPTSNTELPIQGFLASSTGNQLRRTAKGRFSWLAFIAPKLLTETLVHPDNGPFQAPIPANSFDLWVVVLHERNLNNAALMAAEESIAAVEVLGGGEIDLIGNPNSTASAITTLRTGDWLMLRQSVNLFPLNYFNENEPLKNHLAGRPWFYERMAWYRVISVDDELQPYASVLSKKSVTLAGPDWSPNSSSITLAVRIEGVVGVYRKTFELN